jgi:hypothetical protein
MTTIEKISLERVNSTICPKIDNLNGSFAVVCFLSNGGIRGFQSFLSEIGNHGLDSWSNIERIKKSTSNKNRLNYIKKFEPQLNKLGFL